MKTYKVTLLCQAPPLLVSLPGEPEVILEKTLLDLQIRILDLITSTGDLRIARLEIKEEQ